MRLTVDNFGPIVKGDIEIKPFTILTGPNASGKSYILYLLWTLIEVEPDWDFVGGLAHATYHEVCSALKRHDINAVNEAIKDFFMSFLAGLNTIIVENLGSLLRETFMVSTLSKLVGRQGARSLIEVKKNRKLTVLKVSFDKEGKLNVEVPQEALELLVESLECECELKGSLLTVKLLDHGEAFHRLSLPVDDSYRFIRNIGVSIPIVLLRILDYCPAAPTTVILPDGRAGLLRVLEPLSHVLITVKWTPISVNAVDKEFFKTMITLSPSIKSEDVARIADMVERELKVKFIYRVEKPRALIYDEEKGVEVPLEMASSGMRELAPLVYVMRYALGPGQILIVEEPEAHLHPDAQSIIVRALARLIRLGIRVLASTHSVHVLDEVNNLVALSKLSEDAKKAMGYYEDEGLKPADVAVYMVRKNGEVVEAEVTEDGISETDMDLLLEEMANRYAAVRERTRW